MTRALFGRIDTHSIDFEVSTNLARYKNRRPIRRIMRSDDLEFGQYFLRAL